MADPNVTEPTWRSYDITPGEHISVSTGTLQLTASLSDGELWLAAEHLTRTRRKRNPARRPPDVHWERWALRHKTNGIKVAPALPDRSLVVKPDTPFRMLPGVHAKVYVLVPVWVNVFAAAKDNPLITTYPSVRLSDTWFGNPMEGEQCYWLSSPAKRSVAVDELAEHLVICPVSLKNSSGEQLLVEKLCLRVRWLSLFDSEGQLWANETRVSWRGTNDMSRVTVANGAPSDAPEA
ncbi:MAG: DUF432 domain-containing protein, partial [Bdellovibrionales bacterium]|nr:DUF432 domain-containing protein [Bdellovibrionales bacterium]